MMETPMPTADQQLDLTGAATDAAAITTLPAPEPHAAARKRASVGDHAGAAEMFAVAVARSPEDVDALLGHGAALLALGQYEAAEREIRRAMRIAPDRADVHLQLGLALYKRATYGTAALALRRTLEIDPDSVLARVVLGETLNQLGETAEAIEHLERAIAAEPTSRAYYALGLAFDRRGQPDRAAEMYRRSRDQNGH
jgi:tetratricopeptide (TPR) repeat protein